MVSQLVILGRVKCVVFSKSLLHALFLFTLFSSLYSQNILNGDFELNNGIVGSDYLDLDNQTFNDLVESCYNFGDSLNSVGGLDLISSSNWGVPAYSGNWYLGISNVYERFSLELTSDLSLGNFYILSFYQAARAQNGKASIRIGLSEIHNHFGILIFEGEPPSTFDSWEFVSFSFQAPNNGRYLTIECKEEVSTTWLKIDDFCLSIDSVCIPSISLDFPNVFSPNSDNLNDFFKVISMNGIIDGRVSVFNRWGRLIYEADIFSFNWDGNCNGLPCSEGTYFYIANYTGFSGELLLKSGLITLFR